MKYKDLYDLKIQGFDELPISIFEINQSSFDYIMPVHWHSEFEILRVVSGELELYVNSECYLLKAGDFAFINCNYLHHAEPHDCFYEYIDFDLQILRTKYNNFYLHYIEPLQNGESHTYTTLPHREKRIEDAIENLFEALKEKSALSEIKTISSIFTIFEYFFTNSLTIKNSLFKKYLRQAAIVSNLMHWIDDKYTDNISLTMLAEKAQLSQNYICKIFKEYARKTPIEYINEVRIRNICREFEKGETNVTAVATRNGYNDISYFCKVFKKHTGLTAKKYAAQHGIKLD